MAFDADAEEYAQAHANPSYAPCPKCTMPVRRGAKFCEHCGVHLASLMPHPAEDDPRLMAMPSLYAEAAGAAKTPGKTAVPTASSGRGPSAHQRQQMIDSFSGTLAELGALTDRDLDPPRADLAAGDRRLAQAEAAEHQAAERLRSVLDQVDAMDPGARPGSLPDRVQGAKLAASRGQLRLSRIELDELLFAHEEWHAAARAAEQARRAQNDRLRDW